MTGQRELLSFFNLTESPFSKEIPVDQLHLLPSVQSHLAAAQLHRLWLVPLVQQRLLDPLPLFPQVRPQVLDAHSVDPRRPSVALHLLAGGPHVLPLDYLLEHPLLAPVAVPLPRRDV